MLRRFLLCWNHVKIFIRLRIKEKVFHLLPGSEQLLVLRTSASIRRSVFRTSDRTDHSAERRSEASEPWSSRLASSDREPNPESAELIVAFTMCGKIKQGPSLYQPPLGSIRWLKLVICYIADIVSIIQLPLWQISFLLCWSDLYKRGSVGLGEGGDAAVHNNLFSLNLVGNIALLWNQILNRLKICFILEILHKLPSEIRSS